MSRSATPTFDAPRDEITRRVRWFVIAAPLIGFALSVGNLIAIPRNPAWVVALLVCALALTAGAWLLVEHRARVLDFFDRHGARVVLGLIAAVGLGFVALNFWQAAHFALGAYPEDLAYYNQVLWNTLDGRFLSGNVQQERLYDPPVHSELALHVSPLLLAVLLPLYALASHFMTLLVVRDVALVAAAWPLFKVARERLGSAVGLAAAVLYLCNPAVLAQGFGSLTLLQFAPLPFFFALLAVQRKNFRQFLLWTLMTLAVREDTFVMSVGLGAMVLLARYPLRWAVAGLGLPVIWWAAVTLLIQPAFGRWANSSLDVALAGGEASPLGLYRTLLGSVGWIIDALQRGGANFLYELLRSVGALSLLGLEGVMALPSLAASLFIGRVYFAGTDPLSRFALLAACALIGSSVLIVLRRAPRLSSSHARLVAVAALLFLPAMSLLDGFKEMVRVRLVAYVAGHDAAALNQAIDLVPDDASVAAPTYALPALSRRARLYTLEYLPMYDEPQVSFYLIDRNVPRITNNPELRASYVALLEKLADARSYRVVWQSGEYALFETVGGSP